MFLCLILLVHATSLFHLVVSAPRTPIEAEENIVTVYPECGELEPGEECPAFPRVSGSASRQGRVGPFDKNVIEYLDPITNVYVTADRSPTEEDYARGGHFHLERGPKEKWQRYKGSNPFPMNTGGCTCGNTGLGRKIVGGFEVPPHKYPFLVSLQFKSSGRHFCGGSLINDRYVLTAAHCLERRLPYEIQVQIGDHNIGSNTDTEESPYQKTLDVHTIISHRRYNRRRVFTDISLVKLKTPVEFNFHVQPVCMNNDLTINETGLICRVAGWGVTQAYGSDTTATPRETVATAMTPGNCLKNSKYPKKMIRPRMMCAKAAGADACQGDSGGPLFWENDRFQLLQLGIVSWGIGCAFDDYPGVYTRLSRRKLMQWIYVNTEDAIYCK